MYDITIYMYIIIIITYVTLLQLWEASTIILPLC